MAESLIYIAASSQKNQHGISVCTFEENTGKLEVIQTIDTVTQGEYLNFDASKSLLYASVMDNNSEIHVFAVDKASGKLSPINSQATDGVSPCYVSINADRSYALVVNYTGADGAGSIAIFPLKADGQVEPHSDFIQLEGRSLRDDRQSESHPHQILTTPDNRFVLIPDLGTDKIMVYQLNTENGKLMAHDPAFIKIAEGAGPRHVAHHPTQAFMYLINELNSTLIAYRYHADKGTWSEIATHSSLPADYEPIPDAPNYPADVNVHPSGRFVYGSNRGHNSIVIYAIDEQIGDVSLVGHQSTLGNWPRSFLIDPSGQFMFVGNQLSDTVQVFKIDAETGLLNHINTLDIVAPLAIRMG